MIAVGLALVVAMFAYIFFASQARKVEWYLGRLSNFDVVVAWFGIAGAGLVVAGLVKLAWTYLP